MKNYFFYLWYYIFFFNTKHINIIKIFYLYINIYFIQVYKIFKSKIFFDKTNKNEVMITYTNLILSYVSTSLFEVFVWLLAIPSFHMADQNQSKGNNSITFLGSWLILPLVNKEGISCFTPILYNKFDS